MIQGILIFFHVIACLSLIAAILLQVGKGHGLSGASFGSEGAQSIFGTKTSQFLGKATTVTAITFIVTCLTLDVIYSRKSKSLFGPTSQQTSQVDVAKLKEVLEQVKAEQAAAGKSSDPLSTLQAAKAKLEQAMQGEAQELSIPSADELAVAAEQVKAVAEEAAPPSAEIATNAVETATAESN